MYNHLIYFQKADLDILLQGFNDGKMVGVEFCLEGVNHLSRERVMSKSSTSILRLAIIGGSIVLVVAGLRAGAHIVNTILIAYVLILLAQPVHSWLTQRRVPSFVAVILILVLMVGVILLAGWFLVRSLQQFEQVLPQYMEQIGRSFESLGAALPGTGIDLSQIQLPSLSSLLESALLALGSLVAGLVSSLTTLGLILVIVFFGLLEINKVPQRIFHAFSGDDEIVGRLRDVNDGLRRYLVLKAVTGLAMAVPDTILLLIIGVPFAFLWGLLVFFMNFVPNVGFFISLIPPVVIAYLQFGLTEAVVVLAGFLIVNSLVNTFISPRIMGHGLDLSPTLIFIALLFWGWVLGGVGIFMAVPLLVMIKVLAGHYDDSRWMAVVLSERVAEPSQD